MRRQPAVHGVVVVLVGSPWVAWPRGTDPAVLSRRLRIAHERFVTGDRVGGVRPVILESWRRCAGSGIDPDGSPPVVDLLDGDLDAYRRTHPLAKVMPVIRRLLVADAVDDGFVVAVTDADGRILWLEGDSSLRRRAESMRFLPGAVWREDVAGTNAPGVALTTGHSVQVFSSEHFRRTVQPWSCSAAPVHDPATGKVLGVVDVTGGDSIAAPQVLTMVRAAVAAAEAELGSSSVAVEHDTGLPLHGARDRGVLRVLGRAAGVLQRGARSTPLTLRHSEVLLLLATAPVGHSAVQLALELHEEETAAVTTRAEMSRLRQVLGPDVLGSGPYRLTEPLHTDVAALRDLLHTGDVAAALDLYRGPVLPESRAPGVVALREHVSEHLRASLLTHADPWVLLRYAALPEARDDVEVWRACSARLPPGTVEQARARGHLRWLDRQFGAATPGQRVPG